MFTDYMSLLFKEWDDNSTDSMEFNSAVQLLCNEGAETSHIQSQRQEILIQAVSAERQNAFRGGFACMLRLMLEAPGGLSEKA